MHVTSPNAIIPTLLHNITDTSSVADSLLINAHSIHKALARARMSTNSRRELSALGSRADAGGGGGGGVRGEWREGNRGFQYGRVMAVVMG